MINKNCITIMNKEQTKYQNIHQREKILKSFYHKRQTSSQYSPDNKSQDKDSIKQDTTKKSYHSSLPRAQQISSRASQVQSQSRPIASPKTARNSVSPYDPVHKSNNKSSQKIEKVTNNNRYHLKQALQRQKKQHTSPNYNQNSQNSHKKEEETLRIHEKKENNSFHVKSLLTAQQYGKFGQRFPQKFKRVALLGRGGFSVVWLGVHKSSKRKVAIKQILSKNPYQTHLKQIWFCSYFFDKGGDPREQFVGKLGITNLCRMYTYQIQSQDSWLYYELCQESLGSSLFDLKGQNNNGQRSYKIQYGQLLYRIKSNQKQLKNIIVQVAKALTLINSHSIVHSDLKSQNIMITTRKGEYIANGENYVVGLKLIDFGSSFLFNNLRQFSMATPQYMPPQILNYILFQNNMEYDKIMLQKMALYKNPWIIDIWSLGCILLEIVSGVPLWMSVNTRISTTTQTVTGLFAVKNRVFSKIIQKQIQVVNQLDYHLKEHNWSGIILGQQLKMALRQMLCLDPTKRISPWELLNMLGVKCEQPLIPAF